MKIAVPIVLGAGVCCAMVGLTWGENLTQGALGAAPQPKIATPAAAPTTKAGQGGGPGATAPAKALEMAIAACDLDGALALGASADDAARILTAGKAAGMLPHSAAWVKSASGGLVLAYLTADPPGQRSDFGPANFPGFAPPGGVNALPTEDEVFGPGPTPPNIGEELNELGRQAVNGLPAPDAAAKFFSTRPTASTAEVRPDPTQAFYIQNRQGGFSLQVPLFWKRGLSGYQITPLPGTKDAPEPPGVQKLGVRLSPPKIPTWVTSLPQPSEKPEHC